MVVTENRNARGSRVSVRRILVQLSRLMILGGTILTAAEGTAGQNASKVHSTVLPQSCLEQSHPSEQVTALLESLRDHPTSGAYNTLGVLYAQSDRVSCAIAVFETALKLEPQNWEIHYNLALALLSKGDRARAVRELQIAIQQKPDSVSSHFALASILEDEKKWGQAEEQYRLALQIDPRFAQGAIKLSGVLIIEGKSQAAVTSLENSIKQEPPPDQAESLQEALGAAYAANGEMEKGLKTLKDLVAEHPDSAHAHFSLGLLYTPQAQTDRNEDERAAITEFREALRLQPSMDAARMALGQALMSSQQYADAVPVLIDYTNREPKDAQGFYALGQAYEAVRKSDLAIGAFQHAASLAPRDAAMRLHLGMLLSAKGQTAAAIEQLQVAERIDPSDLATHKELAALFQKAGDTEHFRIEQAKLNAVVSSGDKEAAMARLYDEANRDIAAGKVKAAAESYRKALQLNPRDAKLHYNLALALDRVGDVTAERKELQRAAELDPNFAAAPDQLGLLALNSGQLQEAEKLFQKALAIDPGFAEAQSNLGVLYSQQGKNAEAEQRFQQAIKNDPKYSKATVNLGLLMAQRGAFAEAEQQFRTAIQTDPSYAGAYAALGMLLAKTGRGTEAIKSFQQAVTLEPASARPI